MVKETGARSVDEAWKERGIAYAMHIYFCSRETHPARNQTFNGFGLYRALNWIPRSSEMTCLFLIRGLLGPAAIMTLSLSLAILFSHCHIVVRKAFSQAAQSGVSSNPGTILAACFYPTSCCSASNIHK